MAKKNIVQKRMIWQKPEIDGGRIGNNPLLLRISLEKGKQK